MIEWMYYPKSKKSTPLAESVVEVFAEAEPEIDSGRFEYSSNQVLAKVAAKLELLGFAVESGKASSQKISVPVLFGLNGKPEKTFDADGYHREHGFVIEVEAGRAVSNNQFLKDLFQACAMHDVRYLAIAVRRTYKKSADFQHIVRFLDTLYASDRLRLPLEGILIVGY
jgi:hypothetical protein